ncbi:MAG: hypothetical protein K8R67_16660, partial [Desulfobacteraceae bacterium]|nr:hypothetical protein [Desulfobacteraceae bacterium]
MKLDAKKIYIEIHTNYKKKLGFYQIYYDMYLDWWINWVYSSHVKIKYINDKNLLFSHPLAFYNLIIDNRNYLIGFDLWDKYPLFVSNCTDKKLIDRWEKCDLHFKTNYFDAKSPFRYRAPLSYVKKDEDKGRTKAEEAYFKDNIFPGGMPLLKGKYFLKRKYKSFRSRKKIFNVNISGGIKKYSSLRNEMIEKLYNRYDNPRFINSYPNYLKTLGKTKICVDFPSNSRVTFRSSEAISMGSFLVGPPT